MITERIEEVKRRGRVFIFICVFILPTIIGLFAVYASDVDYILEHDTQTVLVSLSAAIFSVMVVSYTLIQLDKTRSSNFIAFCTTIVGILFMLGIVTGVLVLINDTYHVLLETMLFFNVVSILSATIMIITFLFLFKVWHNEKWFG